MSGTLYVDKIITEGPTLNLSGDIAITRSSSSDALRITQTGTGNALVVEDSANPDSTPFVVDANGKVVIGTTEPLNIISVTPSFQVVGTTTAASQLQLMRFSADVGGAAVNFRKSRGSSIGDNTLPNDGDIVGSIGFWADDGTTQRNSALIAGHIDGTPGASDMPGRLVFSTTADGDDAPTERMRIDSFGRLLKGLTAPLSVDANGTVNFTQQLAGANSTGQLVYRGSNDANAPKLYLGKSRGTYNSPLMVNSGDVTGQIDFGGYDGDTTYRNAIINAIVDGTPGANDMPGRLVFYTTSSGSTSPEERMRITSDGKVGIGTGSPSQELVLSKDQNATTALLIENPSVGTAAATQLQLAPEVGGLNLIAGSSTYTGSAITGGASGAGVYTSSLLTNGLSVGTTAGPLKFFAGSTTAERMRIASDGKVGIGTDSPSYKLHVVDGGSSMNFRDNGVVSELILNSENGGSSALYFGDTADTVRGGIVYDVSDNSLQFRGYNNTERMRIDSSGKVGIGTISPNALLEISSLTGSATPTPTELRISTATAAASDWSDSLPWGRMSFYGADASDSGPKIQGSIDAVSDSSTGGRMSMVFNTSAPTTGTLTERMRIDSNGSVGIGMIPVSSTYSLSTVADKNVSIGMPSNSWTKVGLRLDSVTAAGILYTHGSFRASWSCNGYRDTSDQWTSLGVNGASGAAMIEQDPLGIIMFRTDATRTTGSPVTVNERMRIDAVGRVGIANTSPQAFLHVDAGGTIAAGIFSLVGANTTNLSSTPPLLNVMYGSSLRTWAPASDTEILIERNGSVALTLASTASSESSVNFGDPDDENVGEIIYSHADDSMRFNTNAVEAMRITSAKNLKIGGTVVRATTEGTNQLVIFNGTAPVGTLANGVSFYAASGEARVMDAAGNSTLLSPHDQATNEWIFHSKHTPTGKVLRIDVEKMLRFINDHFGLDMIQEFMEE